MHVQKVLFVYIVVSIGSVLHGQASLGDLKNEWLIDYAGSSSSASPSVSVSSPTGYAGDWLNVFASFSTVDRVRYGEFSDGVLSLGLGLGDHQDLVGASVSVNAYNVFGNFGDSLTLSASLSRQIVSFLSLAVGVQNIVGTKSSEEYLLPSYYSAATSNISLSDSSWFNALSLTLGVGNGAYNREVVADRILLEAESNFSNFDVFGALALAIHNQVNLIGNFNGQNVDAGLSVVPFTSLGLVVTGSLLDLLDISGDGVRLGLSVAYNYEI